MNSPDRKPPPPGQYLRPVFIFADECQTFISKFDAEYQAVARASGGCTVYLTQNLVNGAYAIRIAIGQTSTERRHVEAAWQLIQETARSMK